MIQINKVIYNTCYERVASKRQTSEGEEVTIHWGKSVATEKNCLFYRQWQENPPINGFLMVNLPML